MKSLPWLETPQRQSKECDAFNVVLLYEDQIGGRKAVQALNKMSKSCGNEVEFCLFFWGSDMLDNPNSFCVALNQGIKADILVIATSSSDFTLNSKTKQWIDDCFSHKKGTGTVIALFNQPGRENNPNPPQVQFIEQAAKKAGLEFYSSMLRQHTRSNRLKHKNHQLGDLEESRSRFDNNANFLDANSSYRHWGINE